MAQVTVYRVRKYDIFNDEYQESKRMATRAGAELMGAEVLDDTAREIDESQLEPGEQWTRRNFGLPIL